MSSGPASIAEAHDDAASAGLDRRVPSSDATSLPPPRLWRTTPFRIAAGIVALFVAAAALIVAILFQLANQALTDQVLATLRSEAKIAEAESRTGGLAALQALVADRSRHAGQALYYLASPDGTKLAGNLSRMPPELVSSGEGGVFRYEPAAGASLHLAVAIPLQVSGGSLLIVGRDIEDQRHFARRMQRAFMIGFGVLSVAALAAGLAIGRLVARRIAAITDTSRSIMAGDLKRRIPLAGTGDELDDLALSLNAMLERIDLLMSSLREVSDNIAHDLKTPLNRLRNRAEEALRGERGVEGYREGLERTIEMADEVIKTFNALLLIARLEAGTLAENAEAFDIADLVRDVGELYDPVAEEAGLTLRIDAGSGPVVVANRQLVGQAIANMVDNAIKYSSRDTSERPATSGPDIVVSLAALPTGPEISVADRGPGIPPSDRKRVLKRFVRLEASRTRPGTGLGLSLVAAVARLHAGSVRLEDNAPGLRIVLALPRRVLSTGSSVDADRAEKSA